MSEHRSDFYEDTLQLWKVLTAEIILSVFLQNI